MFVLDGSGQATAACRKPSTQPAVDHPTTVPELLPARSPTSTATATTSRAREPPRPRRAADAQVFALPTLDLDGAQSWPAASGARDAARALRLVAQASVLSGARVVAGRAPVALSVGFLERRRRRAASGATPGARATGGAAREDASVLCSTRRSRCAGRHPRRPRGGRRGRRARRAAQRRVGPRARLVDRGARRPRAARDLAGRRTAAARPSSRSTRPARCAGPTRPRARRGRRRGRRAARGARGAQPQHQWLADDSRARDGGAAGGASGARHDWSSTAAR